MEINLKPEDINQYIKDAILKSTVGETIVISIEKELKAVFDSYRSPIKEFIQQYLREMVKEYMERQDVKPGILEAIEKHINPEVVNTIVQYGVHQFNDMMKNRDY